MVQVMQHEDVQPLVAAAMKSEGRCCMVWGSSCGWLPLYTHLAFGWSCVGVELLPYLVEVATEAAEAEGVLGKGVVGV